MRTLFSAAIIALTISLIGTSCTKSSSSSNPPVDPSTVCNASFYAYNSRNLDTGTGPFQRWRFGAFSLSDASISLIDTLKLPGYTNQGTYNTNNYCYYVFTDSVGIPELIRIDNSGNVTTKVLATNIAARFESLVYNSYSNKMFALKKGITFVDTFVEIIEGTSTFTASNITTVSIGATRMSSTTVSQTDGVTYLAMNYMFPSSYKLFSYAPGGTTLTQVTSGSGIYMLGIRHNKEDKLLYALKENTISGGFYTIKMNTAGTLAQSDTLMGNIDIQAYSTCLDVCDKKYIISTTKLASAGVWDTTQSAIYQVSTNNGTNQYNEVHGMVMGLEVKY